MVSGGIHINAKGEATPVTNAVFLLVGALALIVLGTTGLMLLIRPWIRMNEVSHHGASYCFFYFHCFERGLPDADWDPLLFLGYLNGIPFLVGGGALPADVGDAWGFRW